LQLRELRKKSLPKKSGFFIFKGVKQLGGRCKNYTRSLNDKGTGIFKTVRSTFLSWIYPLVLE